jgi:putative ABC transport system permease protein
MTKARAIFRQSVAALTAHKGRSLLTVLGIVIGIASVITLVSLGAGVQATIAGELTALGANHLMITPGRGMGPGGGGMLGRDAGDGGNRPGRGPGGPGGASSLAPEDLAILEDRGRFPRIDLVSAQISGSGIFATREGERRYAVLGTSPTLFAMQGLRPAAGTLFKQGDLERVSRVAVLGHQVAAAIFGEGGAGAAIGSSLTIAGADYRVVGILAPAAESMLANPNAQVFIPHPAAAQDFGVRNFDLITVRVASAADIEPVREEIAAALLDRRGITDAGLADFGVSSSADLLELANTITGTLTALLAAIAAISLLVGGIGIMNIMLVSVTERTREIGLRKAVGANERDILGQFILEAVMLTVTGGVLGIGLGTLMGKVAGSAIGVTAVITPGSVALATGVSTAVGLLFGIYPAARAAALDPMVALRYE